MRLTVLTDLSCMFPLLILSIISLMAFAIGSLGAAAERLFVIEWIWVGTPEPNSSNTISAFPTLKTRGTLGRVNFRKDFWDCYRRQEKKNGQLLTDASSVTIPQIIAGHISASIPFSFLKWQKPTSLSTALRQKAETVSGFCRRAVVKMR